MKWFKCCYCGKNKPETEFYKDKSKKTGYKPRCKGCDLLSVDKNRRAKYEIEYWNTRREHRRKIIINSHNKNKEHHKKQRREYLKTECGIEMYRRQTQKRYALRRSAFVEDIKPKEIYEIQNGVCYICGEQFQFCEMELDHIIPIARGGLHERSNVAMACVHCNRSKGAKMPWEVFYQVV